MEIEASPKKNYTGDVISSANSSPSLSPPLDMTSFAFTDRRGCSLLQISCSIGTDIDEVVVPVSVGSSGHKQKPEVKIGHVTICRNPSWIYRDDCL